MTSEPADATTELPLVAFIGESQVGKSSLVNALAGARLLPTTGTGAPRSQAVCEWAIPAAPGAEAAWRISAAWLSRDAIVEAVEARHAARGRLLREGIDGAEETALARTTWSQNGTAIHIDLSIWAAGRDTAWLPLDIARPEPEARRQVEMLTAGWPAALASCVRIRSDRPASVCLVDLPGLGHDDVGGEATEAWLTTNGSRVAAIVCVVGKRTPEILEEVLHRHWLTDEIRERLHVVATFADHLVEDHTSEVERRRAADARRQRAVEHLRGLVRGTVGASDALPRTFCLDPRPTSRFWRKVEFDGELERLRQALRALRPPPPRPAVNPVVMSPPDPVVIEPQSVPQARADLPMAMQIEEDMEVWLSRHVLPALRKGRWQSKPLRSGQQRLHLNAADSRGRLVTLVTIYGTGETYYVGSARKTRLSPPYSEAAGKQLYEQLLYAARALGVAALEPFSAHNRSAR